MSYKTFEVKNTLSTADITLETSGDINEIYIGVSSTIDDDNADITLSTKNMSREALIALRDHINTMIEDA